MVRLGCLAGKAEQKRVVEARADQQLGRHPCLSGGRYPVTMQVTRLRWHRGTGQRLIHAALGHG